MNIKTLFFPEKLPAAYDQKIYKEAHADLAAFSSADLLSHFELHGKNEGRTCNAINSRHDFLALIDNKSSILEIGPFFSPIVTGPNVKYFDVLNKEELIERAKFVGGNPDSVPYIDYVEPTGNLDCIDRKFQVVVSSHNIEHQPDLIDHFGKIEKILEPGGLYFCIVPDKRYCFDHYNNVTTIADVITKHLDKVKVHSFKSVIEHICLTTHNDALRHWAGDHGPYCADFKSRYAAALKEFTDAKGGYVDVHASFFTPDSFSGIMARLKELELTKLSALRVYPTRKNQLEFFVIMENSR